MDYVAPVNGWPKGVDNVHTDQELPTDTLRRGVNVDVLDSGKVRRRSGHTLVTSLSGAHSMWSDGARSYFAYADGIHEFFEDGTTALLGAFVCGANPVSFSPAGDEIVLTCKTARAAIRNGMLVAWGIDTPVAPAAATATVGVLPAGTYHIAVTYVDGDGRESGASVLSQLVLTATGGIAITSMPIPTDPTVTAKRLYVSTTDGEVLYRAAELLPADQFAIVSTLPNGAELRTAYMSPPPLGVGLSEFNGRVFIIDAADPKTVWFTEAMDYGHVDKRKGFYRFPADVTMIASVDDGVYFAADQTYFVLNAGTSEHAQRPVLEAGAVARSATTIPQTTDVIWMSDRGAVVGKNGGVVEILSGNRVSSGGMIDGAAFVRESNSIKQYVVVGSSTQSSALQAGSYAEAEIIRRSV